jgi:hypothetical protein
MRIPSPYGQYPSPYPKNLTATIRDDGRRQMSTNRHEVPFLNQGFVLREVKGKSNNCFVVYDFQYGLYVASLDARNDARRA